MPSHATVSLYHIIWAHYRRPFLKIILLNLVNAAVSVGIITLSVGVALYLG